MALTREEVKALADLARLRLTDEEVTAAEKDLDAILGYVVRLQKIPTENVDPMTMPAKEIGWRKDEEMACDEVTQNLIIENFPEKKGLLLSVPPVFEKPKK